MDTFGTEAAPTHWIAAAAVAALVATAISVIALVALHVVSPEFQPSWRMVSEYANGRHRWILTVMFLGWAAGSFLCAVALWPLSATTLGTFALAFMILAGIGQTMGGLFDINHTLHGLAFGIGVPSLCIAAVLGTVAMARRTDIDAPPTWSAHLPWISFVVLLVTLALFFAALKGAGVDVAALKTEPLETLPEGVSAYLGYANRLLFAASYTWTALAALAAIKAR